MKPGNPFTSDGASPEAKLLYWRLGSLQCIEHLTSRGISCVAFFRIGTLLSGPSLHSVGVSQQPGSLKGAKDVGVSGDGVTFPQTSFNERPRQLPVDQIETPPKDRWPASNQSQKSHRGLCDRQPLSSLHKLLVENDIPPPPPPLMKCM